ncbi:MAG: hypothetical protein ABI468_12000, partial [Candidatus Nanopelagicales bacterium]
ADTRAPSSYITVDLTPANVAPADVAVADFPAAEVPAADVPAADVALADLPPAAPVDVPAMDVVGLDVAATDVPAGDHAQLHPDIIEQTPSDLGAIDATADEPSPTDHELADHGTTQLQVPYSDGQNPSSDDLAQAWGDDGSVLDQYGAAHLSGPNSGALQGLPPPVAGSVVLDVPPPVDFGRLDGPQRPESGLPDALLGEDDAGDRLIAAPAFMSAREAESVPAQPVSAGVDGLVLDVRDPADRSAQRVEPGSHVVLGFGDGTEQQLAGDNPDISAFHALAAALTSAPGRRG